MTIYVVNNKASSFAHNAHPCVLINLFTGLHAKVDLHNSLLECIIAGEEKRESFAELGHQLEVQIEMMSQTTCGLKPTPLPAQQKTADLDLCFL